tara:strand:- start:36208 stop:36417 length:210 start_codon:yes stop_codon:yes gene_type:complete
MNFESFDSFINMGGHGLYVWLSYGVGLCVFVIALTAPLMKRKSIIKELSQLQRRKQRSLSSNENSTGIT